MKIVAVFLSALSISLSPAATAADAQARAEQETYFETHVRPLLVEHCVHCHGPDEQAGELRLDRAAAVQRGGGSGPIVVPGKPEESLLLLAVGYRESALQMPPDEKLSDEAIEILSRWVKAGAYWPEDSESDDGEPLSPAELIEEMRRSHWAYNPVRSLEPPAVQNADWPQGAVDRFILARLEESGLGPNPPADRRTLIHRAYFTLTGLPPSYEEVEAFVADDSPEAFAQLVDSLLDSPHYGERWARHWMDIARYADTTGYLAGSRDTRYPYAYTYRDYLIRAFNEDKPFDRFILEQIAADRLELQGEDRKDLAAMGFLTVGRQFMGRVHDIIDDRIDVVTRGFLGTTVACARCHDHKYDPIPTADYYSLYGVFASSDEPEELPLLGDPQPSPEYESFLKARGEKQKEVDDWVEERRVEIQDELRSRVADYLVHAAKTLPQYASGEVKQQGSRGALRRAAVQRWQGFLAAQKDRPHPVWSLWHRLAALPADEFADEAPSVWNESDDGDPPLSKRLRDVLRENPPASMAEAAERIGGELEAIYARRKEAASSAEGDDAAGEDAKGDKKAEPAADPEDESLYQLLIADDSPTTLDTPQAVAHLDQGQRNDHNNRIRQVRAVDASHPGAPPRGMVMVDKPNPHEPVIFRRGQPGNRGDRVPRRFLQVLAHVDGGKPFQDGSGRLELAKAIADPNNPLTARVIVNRVWQHQFGAGLVRTSGDFGTRGEPPTHPELLDHLAAEFVADGWSIKRLQRRLMLSAAWQQSSEVRDEAMQADPENRLVWHMPRRRLEFEPLRDRLLVASGRLDDTVGGRSVMIHQDAARRALYAFIDREDLPSLLAAFDLPSPDAGQPIRTQTTVPQQALYLMNNAFIIDQARALAQASAETDSPEARVRRLYRRTLARDPQPHETELAKAFVAGEPIAGSTDDAEADEEEKLPEWRFGYGRFDEATGEVDFTPLPHFGTDAWQGGGEYPHPEFDYLRLTPQGGHPGSKPGHNAIRRWVSPLAGKIKIEGTAKHSHEQGDGIEAVIVSSREGAIARQQIQNAEVAVAAEVTVQPGDTIDFIVDQGKTASFDSFAWAPVIRVIESDSDDFEAGRAWNASADFAAASRRLIPPVPADPWVQLAQVLLLCNEFAFVD